MIQISKLSAINETDFTDAEASFRLPIRSLASAFLRIAVASHTRRFGRINLDRNNACDALHRGRKKDTHPTHGRVAVFCGFSSKRGACSHSSILRILGFQGRFEQAGRKRLSLGHELGPA